jgi:hypothetical protein
MIEQRLGRPAPPKSRAGLIFLLLNLLATLHVVWFYLARVQCLMDLRLYEQGQERTPFQYRLLLMAPLRWAHHSQALHAMAAWLTSQRGFFPKGVRPEGIVEAAIDALSVAFAGLIARRIYQLSSRTGLLTGCVYPATMLMVSSTYSMLTMHAYRFVYDLPAMAFFSAGLYLIYARAHPVWFAAAFLLGTTNRETTLLLLVFFLLARCGRGPVFDWKQSYSVATLRVFAPLAAFWLAWHLWVVHVFRQNTPARGHWIWLNLGILAIPITWPQMLAAFSYALPLVIVFRRHITDNVLRRWLWALPAWFVFMMCYGLLIEIRIFGELIPYIACVSLLIAEEKILIRLQHARSFLQMEGSGRVKAGFRSYATSDEQTDPQRVSCLQAGAPVGR